MTKIHVTQQIIKEPEPERKNNPATQIAKAKFKCCHTVEQSAWHQKAPPPQSGKSFLLS